MLVNNFYFNNNGNILTINSQNEVFYNGNKITIDNEKLTDSLMNIIYIICNWNSEYIDTSVIDGNDWKIAIEYVDGVNREYRGHGMYPDNFDGVNTLIKEIVGDNL